MPHHETTITLSNRDKEIGIKLRYIDQNKSGDGWPKDQLTAVIGDLIVALGLARVLTLLPIHNPGLDEIEERLACSIELIAEARDAIARGEVR